MMDLPADLAAIDGGAENRRTHQRALSRRNDAAEPSDSRDALTGKRAGDASPAPAAVMCAGPTCTEFFDRDPGAVNVAALGLAKHVARPFDFKVYCSWDCFLKHCEQVHPSIAVRNFVRTRVAEHTAAAATAAAMAVS